MLLFHDYPVYCYDSFEEKYRKSNLVEAEENKDILFVDALLKLLENLLLPPL